MTSESQNDFFDNDWKIMQTALENTKDPAVLSAMQKFRKKIGNMLQTVADLRAEISALRTNVNEKIRSLNETVKDLSESLEIEKKKRLLSECNALATIVLIRGLKQHEEAARNNRPENEIETKNVVSKLFETLGIELVASGMSDAVRLPQREITIYNGKKILTDTIKLVFSTIGKKFGFYAALAKNGKFAPEVHVQDMIPKDFLGEKQKLESIASQWRKKCSELRTRVMCRAGQMSLFSKKIGEKRFKQISDAELQKLTKENVEVITVDDTSRTNINRATADSLAVNPSKRPRKDSDQNYAKI